MSKEDVKRSLLKILLEKRESYVSGEAMARKLGVNRVDVERIIRDLKREGYVVISKPRVGYRILLNEEFIYIHEIARYTNIDKIIRNIAYFIRCTSTQDVAVSLVRSGIVDDLLVVCEEQTKGKGRFGRQWLSEPGGLWFSMSYGTPSNMRAAEFIGMLNLAVGVAIANSLRRLYNIEARLKWPNDVLISSKKVAGVLIEGFFSDNKATLVIGVGINVNNPIPKELSNRAISLKRVIGYPVPRGPLLVTIIRTLKTLLESVEKGRADDIVDSWRALTDMLGRRIKVSLGEKMLSGVAEDIDRSGGLVLRLDNGERIILHIGEVIKIYAE